VILAAENRPLFLVCPAGRLHLILGWSTRGEYVFPVVARSNSATPVVLDDPELLAQSRYVLEPVNP